MTAPAKPHGGAEDAQADALASGADLVEWYFEQGWTDGLPVVPPTPATVNRMVGALGSRLVSEHRADQADGGGRYNFQAQAPIVRFPL